MFAKTILVPVAFLAILAGWFQLLRLSAIPGAQSKAPALLLAGEPFLDSPDPHPLFHGGIAPERAHAGDSPGVQWLQSALAAPSHPLLPLVRQASVVGCPSVTPATPVDRLTG